LNFSVFILAASRNNKCAHKDIHFLYLLRQSRKDKTVCAAKPHVQKQLQQSRMYKNSCGKAACTKTVAAQPQQKREKINSDTNPI
jgi:hypothetical protein